ncbi:MAG TPA: Asp23/Gls24 family envelope stress response protein [Clostridia bacterium]|nr:Asp23/Gls24 family envelope stress response protein [Clostridia bacterium]
MSDNNKSEDSPENKIKIAAEVIATIAGISASEIEGVSSMSGGIADGIASILGKKNMGKGVKVDLNEKDVTIDLSIIVQYGCKIHNVARNVQESVRAAILDMTDLNVLEVNINVLGVSTEKIIES